MYRNLLVPVDGSPFAEHALPFALSIARRSGASIQLVHVHVPFTLMYADSMSAFSYEAEANAMAHERAYLDQTVNRVTRVATTPVSANLLEEPVVAETLHGYATRCKTDLIVMTTHGRGPLSRFWLGSVADEMVRRATVPTLLVRPHDKELDLAAEPAIRQILIPLDGTALAEQALEHAVNLGRVMGADYTILRVYGRSAATTSSTATASASEVGAEQVQAQAQEYLNRVAERLSGQGCKVQTLVVPGQYPATAILEAAASCSADLLALETHGRRGLPRLLLGSVADKVVRETVAPVLVHRSSESDSAAGA